MRKNSPPVTVNAAVGKVCSNIVNLTILTSAKWLYDVTASHESEPWNLDLRELNGNSNMHGVAIGNAIKRSLLYGRHYK